MFGSNVLKGIFLLAQGKAAGIAEFGGSADALYASLAPLIAFPLVATVLISVEGQPEAAIIAFLSRLCMVLFVAVVTHAAAAWAGREPLWMRTVTALNWSFWLVIPLLLLAGLIGGVLVSAGVPEMLAVEILVGALAAYLLWYHWFTLHSGLNMAALPALGLVVVTNLVVGLLSAAPALIDQFMAKP
jgi:hypothetical protein